MTAAFGDRPVNVGVNGANPAVLPEKQIPTCHGLDETEMILGNFQAGAFFFSRTPLVVEASRDAGWVTDETVFRGVERFGFAVVRPSVFEVLTGIEP